MHNAVLWKAYSSCEGFLPEHNGAIIKHEIQGKHENMVLSNTSFMSTEKFHSWILIHFLQFRNYKGTIARKTKNKILD